MRLLADLGYVCIRYSRWTDPTHAHTTPPLAHAFSYVCARTRLTTQVELQGLAKVIGLFCLPALLFK